jgi:hypothetical protein
MAWTNIPYCMGSVTKERAAVPSYRDNGDLALQHERRKVD